LIFCYISSRPHYWHWVCRTWGWKRRWDEKKVDTVPAARLKSSLRACHSVGCR
jgi:hypothetical protein